MKKLFLSLFLILGLSTAGYSQYTFPTVAKILRVHTSAEGNTSIAYNLLGTDIHYHTITIQVVGTVSACAVALKSGSDGATFGSTLIAPLTCTSNTQTSVATNGDVNYTRLEFTTPKVGSGTVTVTYQGWQINPYTAIGASISALPADPLGLNADAAASAGGTGSISAKLRSISSEIDTIKTDVASINTRVTTTGVPILDSYGNPLSNSDQVQIHGTIADGSVDSGNPIKIGCKAVSFGTTITAVDSADRSNMYCSADGIPYNDSVRPNSITSRTNFAGSQTDQAIKSVSAGTKIGIQSLIFNCSAATSVSVSFRIGFGTATVPTGDGVLLSSPGLEASHLSGLVYKGPTVVGADDEDLRITMDAPTSGSCDLDYVYFLIAR